jgi:hypothetical protein
MASQAHAAVGDMPRRLPRHVPRLAWALAGAAAACALATAYFVRVEPMHVMVGRTMTAASVPLGYQLSVFPALGAFVAMLALDLARGEHRRTWPWRALLVAATGTLAAARLTGALPLGGHAIFLFAVLGYELAPPTDRDSQGVLGLVMPGLLVVGWCKLVVWSDPVWFAASAAIGLGLGAVLARLARA